MALNINRSPAFVIGGIVVAVVWCAHIFTVFQLVSGFAYDVLMRNDTHATSKQLVVLDGDKQYAESGDEVWMPLLKKLLAQNVKQVVFNFLPERVSADFYQLAADSGKVVFGRHILNSNPYAQETLQPLPLTARGKGITLGLVTSKPSQYGAYRSQYRDINIDGQTLPTLEQIAAQKVLGDAALSSSSDYLINYIGGTSRIPKIKLAQVEAGNLISELVAERTVMVGVYGLETQNNYLTPLSREGGLTSSVFYHAFALDTLLANRGIQLLPRFIMLLVILGITAVTLIFCQNLNFLRSFIVTLLLTLFYMAACWAILQVWLLWVSLADLVLAQWMGYALIWRYRIAQENKALDATLFNLSINLQEKTFPISFYQAQDPWFELIALINQSITLNRMIFLERVPNDHRLREIKAYKCGIDNIIEQRRDYERLPYSSVIQEQKPLLMERPYLKPLASNEDQYLAPLIFAGEVIGFWAFTADACPAQARQKRLALTHAYAIQISEMLYYRQELQKRMARENNRLWAYLNFSAGVKSYQVLNQSIGLLDRRISELQQVFNSIKTSSVLYDLFGRVLLLNKPMEELAKSVDLKLYGMTAVDFIVAVTGYNQENVRTIMQKAIIDHETVSIPIPKLKPDHSFILHILPLKTQEKKSELSDLVPVFQIAGILCNMEDVTELKALYRLKEQMFERFAFQIRNDLTTVVFASSLLEDTGSTDAEKALALTNIQHKIEDTLVSLKTVNEQMNIEIESLANNLGRYPINSQDSIKKVISALEPYAAKRAITLHLKMPSLLSLVFASPSHLYSVFHTLLRIMIDDCFEDADVWVDVDEYDESVSYQFRNQGIGIAQNKLQEFNKDNVVFSNDMLKIDELNEYITYWNGTIDLAGQVGIGSSITVSLKSFL